MAILALGISHHTAPVALRAGLAYANSEIEGALVACQKSLGVREVALLSTCNRTEWYVRGVEPEALLDFWQRHKGVTENLPMSFAYCHKAYDAVCHVMRVAAGLDSMVVGEPHIVAQLKYAHLYAREQGTIGKFVGRLLQDALGVAKRIRATTEVGKHPVSVAYLAVKLAKQVFSPFTNAKVLLLGAGETAELCARHFSGQGVEQLFMVNRNFARAERTAERISATAVRAEELDTILEVSDIVVTATGSPLPLLTKNRIEQVLKKRGSKPLVLIDLSMPPNIEHSARSLPSVYLYTLDDLQTLSQTHVSLRESSREAAEKIIVHHASLFQQWAEAESAVHNLRNYRDKMQIITDTTLNQALTKLEQGRDPKQLMQELAYQLSQKLLHTPTMRMRKAASLRDKQALETLHSWFNEDELL